MTLPRVLHVVEPVSGGVATYLGALVAGQIARGYEVGVVLPTRGEAFARQLETAGAQVHPVEIRSGLALDATDLRAMRGLASVLRSGGWDVLQATDTRAGILGRPVARLLGIPSVYVGQSFAHMSQRAHGSGPLRYALTWGIERSMAAIGDAVVIPSAGFAEEVLATGAIPRSKVRIVHNGYDPAPPVAPDPELAALRAQAPVVGFLSRMTAVKDPLGLVEALAQVRADFRAALVGDGDQFAAVRARVAELGLDGRVLVRPFQGPGPALAAFDVYVLPSRFEPFGIGTLEGMGAGLPCVGARTGGIPEVIEDGVTGLVVEPGDPPGLARALERLLRDPDLRRRMGAAGRERVAQFSVDRMVERTGEVYAAVLRRAGRRARTRRRAAR